MFSKEVNVEGAPGSYFLDVGGYDHNAPLFATHTIRDTVHLETHVKTLWAFFSPETTWLIPSTHRLMDELFLPPISRAACICNIIVPF
jgi:hypothetical protein